MTPPVRIRAERTGDEPAIRRVLESAFPTSAEAQLVDDLRAAGRLTIALIAEREEGIVGHIAFSPVTIAGQSCGLGLAPLAVSPATQRQGIGGALIRAGLEACRQQQFGVIVVLGDPAYYGRFGFRPASQWRLLDEYQGGDAFQAIELIPGSIPTAGGVVRYAPEFAVFG